jgi:hypothetical protein
MRRTHHRTHSPNVKRGSVTVICPSHERAHALRHELDKMGALSKRKGRRVSTTATAHQIAAARRRAMKRTAHHGRTR